MPITIFVQPIIINPLFMIPDLHTLYRVVVLEDNDVVHLRKGAYGIFNALMKEKERHRAVPRALETLNMEVSQIMKGGYDTFMQVETSPLSPLLHPTPYQAMDSHQVLLSLPSTRSDGRHRVPIIY